MSGPVLHRLVFCHVLASSLLNLVLHTQHPVVHSCLCRLAVVRRRIDVILYPRIQLALLFNFGLGLSFLFFLSNTKIIEYVVASLLFNWRHSWLTPVWQQNVLCSEISHLGR